MENEKNRASWSGQLAFVLAAAASAIGLGNLWRFPYLAAQYGGGPFIDSNYIESDADGYSASIEHNDRAYIDAFYQVTTNFKVGIEYARLNTRYAGNSVYQGGNAYADRFQFSAYYDF